MCVAAAAIHLTTLVFNCADMLPCIHNMQWCQVFGVDFQQMEAVGNLLLDLHLEISAALEHTAGPPSAESAEMVAPNHDVTG